jgi:hypothetical protein
MQRIDTVQPYGGGYLAYGVNDGGAKVTVPLLEVRAGVEWPTGKFPGYYLVLGKRAQKNELGFNPLLFLSEGEEPLPQNLYRKLTDDISKMRAIAVYADRGADRSVGMSGCYTDFFDYLGSRGLSISLTPAPSAADKEYGVVLMREHIKQKTLELPTLRMTILLGQLKQMSQDTDYEDFYAFHALRYLLAGFAKFQEPVMDWMMTKPPKRVSAAAWT